MGLRWSSHLWRKRKNFLLSREVGKWGGISPLSSWSCGTLRGWQGAARSRGGRNAGRARARGQWGLFILPICGTEVNGGAVWASVPQWNMAGGEAMAVRDFHGKRGQGAVQHDYKKGQRGLQGRDGKNQVESGRRQGRDLHTAGRAVPEASRSSGGSGSLSPSTGSSRAHTRPWLGWAYRPMSSPRVWKRRTGTPCEVCRPTGWEEGSASRSPSLGRIKVRSQGSELLPVQPGSLLHQAGCGMCVHASDT